MRVRTLRDRGDGSYTITVPKDELHYLGIIDQGGELVQDEQQVLIRSNDDGTLEIEFCGAPDPAARDPAD